MGQVSLVGAQILGSRVGEAPAQNQIQAMLPFQGCRASEQDWERPLAAGVTSGAWWHLLEGGSSGLYGMGWSSGLVARWEWEGLALGCVETKKLLGSALG